VSKQQNKFRITITLNEREPSGWSCKSLEWDSQQTTKEECRRVFNEASSFVWSIIGREEEEE